MPTKRDLVEAHSFSRRRLVTAFVSGAPGGREVEPVRPGRMLVGGLGLAVLLVAGAAVAGVVKPRTPDNWLDGGGMIITKETGADYVVLEGNLHPLANGTSAQLILGEGMDVHTVPRDEIDKQQILAPVGIYGAPDSPLSPGKLVDSGWSACTDGQGAMTLLVDDESHVDTSAADAALVVRAGGARWLVAADRRGQVQRLALPSNEGQAQTMLNGLGIGSSYERAVEVEAGWLNLIPEGQPLALESIGAGLSRPTTVDWGDRLGLDGLKTTEIVTWGDATYLISLHGPVALDVFAEHALAGLAGPQPVAREASSMGKPPVELPSTWPTSKLTPLSEGDTCVVLNAAPGEAATVSLATAAEGSKAAADPGVPVLVSPGGGAFVRSADHGVESGGQQILIDAQGTRYKLGGPGAESARALGYDLDDAPTVPSFWIQPFYCGPELSRAAALLPPDPEATRACDAS